MGFGLLILGYLTVMGAMPAFFVYRSFTVLVPIAGGLIMLAAFRKLQEYNIYFKVMKYICIAYILLLTGFMPYLVLNNADIADTFFLVSKISRIFVLFIFNYFLLCAINALAKNIENPILIRKSKRNIYITYIYFCISIMGIFPMGVISAYFEIASIFAGLIYYILICSMIYNCYMRITTAK